MTVNGARAQRFSRARDALSRDHGMVSSAVLVCALVFVVAVVCVMVLPLLAGTEQKSRSQTAADAAALAGAEAVRTSALTKVDEVVLHGGSFLDGSGAAWGRAGADDYASRNGARVTSYVYDGWADEVRVVAELVEESPADDHTRADADAGIGVRLASCARTSKNVVVGWTEPPPEPTPTPEPTPAPTPTPTPTPTFTPLPVYATVYGFECSGAEGFVVDRTYRSAQLPDLADVVRARFESATSTVRLTR